MRQPKEVLVSQLAHPNAWHQSVSQPRQAKRQDKPNQTNAKRVRVHVCMCLPLLWEEAPHTGSKEQRCVGAKLREFNSEVTHTKSGFDILLLPAAAVCFSLSLSSARFNKPLFGEQAFPRVRVSLSRHHQRPTPPSSLSLSLSRILRTPFLCTPDHLASVRATLLSTTFRPIHG